jgi:hypothetical protein
MVNSQHRTSATHVENPLFYGSSVLARKLLLQPMKKRITPVTVVAEFSNVDGIRRKRLRLRPKTRVEAAIESFLSEKKGS